MFIRFCHCSISHLINIINKTYKKESWNIFVLIIEFFQTKQAYTNLQVIIIINVNIYRFQY